MLHIDIKPAGARALREDRPTGAGAGGAGAGADGRFRAGFRTGCGALVDAARTGAAVAAGGWAPCVLIA